MAQNEKEQNDYRITYYNTVSSKEVDWLWYPYIPYGKITILQGDPGEGKSTMMMQLAALITNGDAMPDGSGDRIPGNVIYQAAEDGIEDTIKPRLEAAGADCSRIAFLEQSDEEPILLNDVRLAQAIEGTKAKLLVIDRRKCTHLEGRSADAENHSKYHRGISVPKKRNNTNISINDKRIG